MRFTDSNINLFSNDYRDDYYYCDNNDDDDEDNGSIGGGGEYFDLSLNQSKQWLPVEFVSSEHELAQRLQLYLFSPPNLLPHLPTFGLGLSNYRNVSSDSELAELCDKVSQDLVNSKDFPEIYEAQVNYEVTTEGVFKLTIKINGGKQQYDYRIQ